MLPVYLSTAYLAPVQYYCKLYAYESVVIEAHEHYVKQSYRNRCMIATANGIQTLSIPVETRNSRSVKDIRISDHGNWQHVHWHALVSAYGMSPYFEYYSDDFAPFYERKYRFLFDWNEQLRATVCELIDIHPHITFSTEYNADVPNDFRSTIRPRHPGSDPAFTPQPYYQIFRDRHGFLPNLSIVDLLFNMGPETIFVLNKAAP